MKPMHEMIQTYFETMYTDFEKDIKQSLFAKGDQIYDELYYYSIVHLLQHLEVTDIDHFLDMGSGLGKLVFQVFLTTHAASVTGIEIHPQRHAIAAKIKNRMAEQLPEMFAQKRQLNLLEGDFLKQDFYPTTIVYICSVVFSLGLLNGICKKINTMDSVKKIASLRKLPTLNNFELTKKIFLHGTRDNYPCYLYARKG